MSGGVEGAALSDSAILAWWASQREDRDAEVLGRTRAPRAKTKGMISKGCT